MKGDCYVTAIWITWMGFYWEDIAQAKKSMIHATHINNKTQLSKSEWSKITPMKIHRGLLKIYKLFIQTVTQLFPHCLHLE